MRLPCYGCGRDTGDRHRYCWRCRHGLGHRWLHEDTDPYDQTCHCKTSRPELVGGIWAGLNLYQCRHCGRKVPR